MIFKGDLRLWIFTTLCIALFGPPIQGSTAQSAPIPDGESLYLSLCGSCHQANGEGISGVFPPLNEVKWVTGDKGRLIRIALDGIVGKLEVGGVVYSGAMPPWKSSVSDEEMAALLTYIRTSWDNEASAVTENEVQSVRQATSERTQAWTYEELSDESNQGIPEPVRLIPTSPDTTQSN